MVSSILSYEIYKISRFSTCTILAIYRFALFQKNSIFVGFYNISYMLHELGSPWMQFNQVGTMKEWSHKKMEE